MQVDESVFKVSGKSVRMNKTILPLENEEISARSVQSSHDTDCDYRDKDGNKVKGYSVNLTETRGKNDDDDDPSKPMLNLINNTRVKVASTANNNFLEKDELRFKLFINRRLSFTRLKLIPNRNLTLA